MRKIIKNDTGVVFQNLFFDLKTGEITSPIITSNYEIVQIADSYFISQRSCGEHYQYCDIEITYSVYNEVFCKTGKCEVSVQKQDAYVSLKGDVHQLHSKNRSRYQTVAVNCISDESKRLFSSISESYKDESKRKVHAPELSDFITSIVYELLEVEKPFSEMLLDSAITAILVNISRRATVNSKSEHPFLTVDILPDILNYIDSNFLNISSVGEIAAKFKYSHSYLCRVFREKYGTTIINYLNEKKLQYAARRLVEGDSCGELAEFLGYSNSANFTRAFKNKFGISPESYRKKEDA